MGAAALAAGVGALSLIGCEKAPPPKAPAPVTAAPMPPMPAPAAGTGAASTAPAVKPERGANADAVSSRKVSTAEDDPTVIEVAGLALSKPVTWVWSKPTQPMRVLQYAVPASEGSSPAAELIFSVFTGTDGGPLQGNLDRWAAFFHNEDGTQAPAERSDFQVGSLKVHRQESAGTYSGMMGAAAPRPGYAQIGAIVEAPDCRVFIRLVGPRETVAGNREAFDAMLRSVR